MVGALQYCPRGRLLIHLLHNTHKSFFRGKIVLIANDQQLREIRPLPCLLQVIISVEKKQPLSYANWWCNGCDAHNLWDRRTGAGANDATIGVAYQENTSRRRPFPPSPQ